MNEREVKEALRHYLELRIRAHQTRERHGPEILDMSRMMKSNFQTVFEQLAEFEKGFDQRQKEARFEWEETMELSRQENFEFLEALRKRTAQLRAMVREI